MNIKITKANQKLLQAHLDEINEMAESKPVKLSQKTVERVLNSMIEQVAAEGNLFEEYDEEV